MTIPRFPIRRQLTPEEGDDFIGYEVEDRVADLHDEGVYYDEETDEPVLLYAPYTGDVAALRNAVRAVKYATVRRGGLGFQNSARTFGMAPRKVHLRRETCTPTQLTREQPEVHRELEIAAGHLIDQLAEHLPEVVVADRENIEKVLPEWRLDDDSVWTSGIINRTSALPYHRDEMNFYAWSAMPVVRRGVKGGHLHIPEYDRTVACRDGWVVDFMGKTLIHGNTPIRSVEADGYRISIVYYALRGMKDCYTYADELRRGQIKRTAREVVT